MVQSLEVFRIVQGVDWGMSLVLFKAAFDLLQPSVSPGMPSGITDETAQYDPQVERWTAHYRTP